MNAQDLAKAALRIEKAVGLSRSGCFWIRVFWQGE